MFYVRARFLNQHSGSGSFDCIFFDSRSKSYQLYVFHIQVMLRVYFNLGYYLARNLLIEESLECDIDNKTTKELSDMRYSYRLAKFKNI